MNQDWTAVGAAITDRLDERGMTMTDLAARSNVSLTTVRELVHVLSTRRRQPRTLAAISESLGWPSDHLARVLRRQDLPAAPSRPDELDMIRAELADLRSRVDALEHGSG